MGVLLKELRDIIDSLAKGATNLFPFQPVSSH